jgi:hypothetical protein
MSILPNTSSFRMRIYGQCGQKWLVILLKILFNFGYQSEEEAGSAGEQLASNKIDAYTVIKSSQQWLLFFFITGKLYGLKKLICDCF